MRSRRAACATIVAPPRADRILLIILDGLGYNALRWTSQSGTPTSANSHRRHLHPRHDRLPVDDGLRADDLQHGASAPCAHGMLGYRLYLREISAVVNMIQLSVVGGRSESPLPEALPAAALLTCPTVYEQLGASGISTHALLPRGIADSGLSRILYRGATHIHPAIGLSDMLALARHILNGARGPSVVTLYWPGLDSIAHPRGPQSDAYVAEAALVAAAIRREIVGRVKSTLLLVSSDHGFTSMRSSDYVPSSRIAELRDALLLFPGRRAPRVVPVPSP